MPLVVMKFVGAKYGNKNVKIILVKKCPYVVMKYIGGKSEQRTYPQGITLLICISASLNATEFLIGSNFMHMLRDKI